MLIRWKPWLVVMLAALPACPALAQYVDLGTDTVYYDKHFEYVAAIEAERFLESYQFYQTALRAYEKGDYLSASAAVSKAIKLNRKEAKFRMLRAWVYSRTKNYKRAIKACERVLEDRPNHREALYARALNQYLLKDHARAQASYTELLSAYPDDARAYLGRAEVKADRGNHRGAADDFTAALLLDNTLPPAYLGRGLAYFRLYEYQLAIRDFNQYLVADPQSGRIYYYRGLAYIRINDYASACKDFEMALRLNYREAAEPFEKHCKL